jgi:hypothetical protein
MSTKNYPTQKSERTEKEFLPRYIGTPMHPFPKYLPKKIALIIIIIFFVVFIGGFLINVLNFL